MAVSFGPVSLPTDELAGLEGVQQAHIYGSWAARYNGGQGLPPADVDVLVVGSPDAEALFDLA